MKKVILAAVSGIAIIGAASIACAQHEENAKSAAAPASMDAEAPKAHKEPMKHHHAKKQHKHHKHHKHHGGDQRTEINGVFVTFPPISTHHGAGVFVPDFYAGNKDCPYVYHGGYFWYPHPRNNVLQGYTPYCEGGACWYASYTHPHIVYIEGENMLAVYPHVVDGAMFQRHRAPMTKKWDSAPDRKIAE